MSKSYLAPTPCLEPGCAAHAINQGRCQEHQRIAFAGSTRRRRLPPDWNIRRAQVLRRDRGICYLCGKPGADTVDHIEPNDDHSLTNLGAVHDRVAPHCHRYKTSGEGHSARGSRG
jgi:5-methylcytosine-specific restriction protein A